MSSVELVEVVYISAAVAPFSTGALRDLLSRARTKNTRLGISGMLLHADGSFLQVLEGPPAKVDALYEQIGADTRHHRVLRVFRTERQTRSFADWSMGFVDADAAMRNTLVGFNDFLQSTGKERLSGESIAKIRDLATQFRMGRWRQNVDPGFARSAAINA